VDFEVGVRLRVNGRRGRNWLMVIAYEPDDTYTVWLVEGHAARWEPVPPPVSTMNA
jgi:hypothetical protein